MSSSVKYCHILSLIRGYCHSGKYNVIHCHLQDSNVVYCHIPENNVVYCHLKDNNVVYCHLKDNNVVHCRLLRKIATYWDILSLKWTECHNLTHLHTFYTHFTLSLYWLFYLTVQKLVERKRIKRTKWTQNIVHV